MKKLYFFLILSIYLTNAWAGTAYYRASFRDDPSTTIVIGWADQGTSTNATVYYGTTDFGTNYSTYPYNHGIDRTISHRSMNNRFARLTNLMPNTVYYFVIKDNEGVSQRMSFKTLSDDPNIPILFISGGDTRTGVSIIEFEADKCRERRQRGNSLVAKIRPDFIAFSGDYVFSGTNDTQWTDWFSDWQLTIGPQGRLTPIVPVFGNHELSEDIDKLFDVPNANGYYALSFGGKLIRQYNLNSEIDCDATQLSWLTNDLQLYSTTQTEPYWKTIQYHVPLVPHGEYSPTTTLISCWAPVFTQYNIRLAMEGHSHVEKTTWPVVPSTATGSDNGFIRDDANGCVYIGEGCWGAPLRNLYTYYNSNAAFNWTRNQGKFTGYFVVKVTKQKIQIQTVIFSESSDVANVAQVSPLDPPATLPSGLNFWNPSNGQVVEIINQHPLSNDATLLNLYTSEGTLSPSFNAQTFSYQIELPYDAVNIPVVSATIHQAGATAYITQAQNLTGTQTQRTAIVKVIAEDGVTINNYTVEFHLAPQPNALLASLTPSQGALNPTFDPQTFNYAVVLPYGTSTIPTVTATPQDIAATVQITQPTSVMGTATIHVTSAGNQSQNTYTVNFSVAPGSAKEIISFNIPGQIGTTTIDQQNLTVSVNMQAGTDVTALVPTITITGVSISPTSGTAQNFTSPVNYTVTAADNSTATYTATVNLTSQSSDATLSFLAASPGQISPNFAPQTTSYTDEIPQNTTSVSITAQTTDPNATKKIFLPSDLNGNNAQRTGIVLVIATDQTTTKTYSILFNIANGISDIQKKTGFSIFPNPAEHIITVSLNDKDAQLLGEIEIYNGMGHLIKEQEVSETNSVNIDIDSFEKGAYMVFYKSGLKLFVQKFIKI